MTDVQGQNGINGVYAGDSENSNDPGIQSQSGVRLATTGRIDWYWFTSGIFQPWRAVPPHFKRFSKIGPFRE